MLRNLRKASDELILAEAMVYFVFIAAIALVATFAARLF